jgi:hypothetical protein
MIIKTYTNYIKPDKTIEIDIEKEFENDNYLIQTLKRTSKFQNDKKLIQYENNLNNVLNLINQRIKLRNNPKTKLMHEENNEFLRQYKYLSETFEKQMEKVLEDLILIYTKKGYHIPKFSYKNNIFKINALIEANSEKLRLLLMEELRNKKNIIGPKTLMFLNKLNYLVKILITKDPNLVKKYNKLLNKNDPYINKESIEQIKIYIKNIIQLLKNVKINKIGSNKPKRKSSFLSKIPQLNNIRISNKKNSIKTDLININNNNNNDILSTEGSLSAFKKRNPNSFLSMRLSNYSIKPNKLINTINSRNDFITSKKILYENKTEENTNINNKKKIFFQKSKPIINLKMKTIFSNISKAKSRNEKILPEYKTQSDSKKTICSDISKYIKQAKINNLYKSEKKIYTLGLRKTSENKIQNNDFPLSKKSSKYIEYSYDNNISKNYNINISSSDTIKKVKTIEKEEEKTQFLWNAYKKIKKGKYEIVEDIMNKYLKDIKEFDINDQNILMKHYNYKNLRNNLFELNMKVSDDSTRKKIEKIYSNIHILKRIKPVLNNMEEKEINIDRLEKIYTSGVNK